MFISSVCFEISHFASQKWAAIIVKLFHLRGVDFSPLILNGVAFIIELCGSSSISWPPF